MAGAPLRPDGGDDRGPGERRRRETNRGGMLVEVDELLALEEHHQARPRDELWRPSRLGVVVHDNSTTFVLHLCQGLMGPPATAGPRNIGAEGCAGRLGGGTVTLEPEAHRRPPEAWADARWMEPMLAAPPGAVVHPVAHRLRRQAEQLSQFGDREIFPHDPDAANAVLQPTGQGSFHAVRHGR